MPRWDIVPILVVCAAAGMASQLVDAAPRIGDTAHRPGAAIAPALDGRNLQTLSSSPLSCGFDVSARTGAVGDQPFPRDCMCKDLADLEKDVINGTELRRRFDAEATILDQDYPPPLTLDQVDNSQGAEAKFTREVAPRGIQGPAGYSGPETVEYTQVDIGLDNLAKYTPDEQCARSNNSQRDLDAAIAGSSCRAMAEGILAHENYHQAQCVLDGGQVMYRRRSGAYRAREERDAYAVEDSVLEVAIRSMFRKPRPEGCLDPGRLPGRTRP
jgi:hypothetical protein